jgi:hypothetical protein
MIQQGIGAVEGVDLVGPLDVGHVGPGILVEAGGGFQALLLDVQHEAVVDGVQVQGLPGHGEQFLAHAEEAAEGQHGVGHLAGVHVEHDFLDVAQVFLGAVDDAVADQRVGPHQCGAGTGAAAVPCTSRICRDLHSSSRSPSGLCFTCLQSQSQG